MAASEPFDARAFDRRLFLWAAAIFVAASFVGFAQTYYLKPFVASPPLRTLAHVHGILMTAWVAFFVSQVYLIRSRRVTLHMTMGTLGIALAAAIAVVGIATAINAAKFGTASAPPDIPPLSFLIVPSFDIVVFVVLFSAAIYYRKRPANHKRLMLLTVFNFLPPAVARFPGGFTAMFGPVWFFGLPDLLLLGFFAWDTWRNGKVNRVFALGTAFVILSHPFRLALMGTETWLNFAAWLTS